MSSIEKAIIVGLVNQKQDSLQTQEFLDELAFLALTSGAKVLNRFTQRLNQPLPNTFIGKGKLGEIKDFVKEHHSYDLPETIAMKVVGGSKEYIDWIHKEVIP